MKLFGSILFGVGFGLIFAKLGFWVWLGGMLVYIGHEMVESQSNY